MEHRNSIYAAAFARKILGLTTRDIHDLEKLKQSRSKVKQTQKSGNYDGTNVGFTSQPIKKRKQNNQPRRKKKIKPIDRHSNYEGTDAGFTADLTD